MKLNFGTVTGAISAACAAFVLGNMIVGSDTAAPDANAVASRVQPVGEVSVGSAVDSNPVLDILVPAAQAAGNVGKATYDKTCVACHGAGIAGAPKFGDKAAWGARIATGKDALYTSALKGKTTKTGFMPAKGGNAALSDADVKAAVDYMVAAAK